MAVLDVGVSSGDRRMSTQTAQRLALIDERLDAARRLLAATTAEGATHGAVSLRAVEDSLLLLARAATTEPQAAAVLVELRDQLSSHLLAAAVVAEADGGAPDRECVLLRRAIASTTNGLALMQGAAVW